MGIPSLKYMPYFKTFKKIIQYYFILHVKAVKTK